MTKKLKPEKLKNKNKCPFSHRWNKDADKTPDCDYCSRWEDCINNRTKN